LIVEKGLCDYRVSTFHHASSPAGPPLTDVTVVFPIILADFTVVVHASTSFIAGGAYRMHHIPLTGSPLRLDLGASSVFASHASVVCACGSG